MWLFIALDLLNCPLAVFLNRLAAPRWVFNFGIGTPWDGKRKTGNGKRSLVPRSARSSLPIRFSFSVCFLSRVPSRLAGYVPAPVSSSVCRFPFPDSLRLCHLRRRLLRFFVRLHGREDLVEPVAEHLGARLGGGLSREVDEKTIEDLLPVFPARHFASAELDRRLHFVSMRQKLQDVLDLEVVVVVVDVRAKFHFFDLCRLLFLLRVLLLLLLLVDELPEVHDPADRRIGGRRDFDQVEARLPRLLKRFGHRHDAESLAG